MTLQDSLTRYTLLGQRRVTRPYLGYSLKTPANDRLCAGCGRAHCHCPDPVFGGVVPPRHA